MKMVLITNKSSANDMSSPLVTKASTMFTFAMAAMLPFSTSSAPVDSLPSTGTSFGLPQVSDDRTLFQSTSRDFENFNKIFENASIYIPEEFQVSEQVAFADLNMIIRNIKCYEVSVGDISVDHQKQSDTAFAVTVGVANLDLTCEMNYDYDYGILSGDGWVQIETENSDVVSTIGFTSLDFDLYPPTSSTIDNCFSNVQIKNLDFEEDFASEVLEVFQSLIRNTVELAIGEVACEELSVLGTAVVGNMVDMAGDQLEPYLGNLGESATDPLYLEHNLVLPDSLEALNLQDTEGHIGKTVNEILRFLDTHLGTTMSDSSGKDDLVINSLLRSFGLDDDGSLRLDPSSVSTMTNPTLFEGHDRLTKFTVTLDEVRLYGLDSITRFNSFRNIGKYTLQNELTWDFLKFEFDLILEMKPSTLEDTILVDPTSPGISEHFTIDFALNNIDVEASLLLVLDEVAMGSMKLGPLFFTENLLPCLLSVVQDAQLSGLDVDPSYINDGPALDGFLSSGFDLLISDSVEAAFAMYEGSLRAAIPNVFQTSVRDMINTFFVETFNDDRESSTCPEPQSPSEEIVDFRKFFDSANGSYGDLPSVLKNMMDDELLTVNPDTGRPRINEALIAPLTGVQSGSEGTMIFPSDLFSFLVPKNLSQTFGLETLEFRLFDPVIENLNTIGTPIQLLEPNVTNGQVLDSYATLGSDERKLRIGFKGLFAVEGDPELTINNQMDLAVEIADSDAWLSFLANVDAVALSNFPLGDITNLQCWLNTIATPTAFDNNDEKGFSIVDALLTPNSMTFNVSCDTCTSSSLSVLPEILRELEVFGVSDVLENRILKMIMDLLRSDYSQGLIDGVLIDASIRCPHSPNFIDSSASSEKSTAEFPSLDYQSLETIVFGSTVVMEALAVVTAEAHELYDLETSFPLSGQSDLNMTNDVRLFDFTSLEESLGKWAGFGVADVNEFLKEIVKDPNELSGNGILRVNSILRSVLNKNGEFSVTLDDLDLKKIGVGISIKEVNIAGLDSISAFKIFDTIGAQTVQNGISWEDIRVRIVMSIEAPDGSPAQDITITAGLSDINLSLAILMAIDLDIFDTLEMWSIMELRNILPCVMSAAETASFTELELSIGSMTEFTITGFESEEVSSAANQSTRMILEKYHDKIVSSIPKVFDSTVRTLLNNWLQYYMENPSSDLCEHSTSEEMDGLRFVDLRDLLWIPSVASRLGGSGLSQYGDMFTLAIGLIRNVFKTDETTGLSGFNEVVVEPLTESEGHEPGSIHYSGDLYTGGDRIKIGALDTNFRFRAYDAKIENLNTVGAPLELFSGVTGEPFKINNTMAAGVGKEPLKFSTKFMLSLEGDGKRSLRNIENNVWHSNTYNIFHILLFPHDYRQHQH